MTALTILAHAKSIPVIQEVWNVVFLGQSLAGSAMTLRLGLVILLAAMTLLPSGCTKPPSESPLVAEPFNATTDPSLVGEWTCVRQVIYGQPNPGGGKVEFTADGLRKSGSENAKWFRADPKASPAAIDLEMPGRDYPQRGIYKIEGKLLTICWTSYDKRRPTSFEPDQEVDGIMIFEYERFVNEGPHAGSGR